MAVQCTVMRRQFRHNSYQLFSNKQPTLSYCYAFFFFSPSFSYAAGSALPPPPTPSRPMPGCGLYPLGKVNCNFFQLLNQLARLLINIKPTGGGGGGESELHGRMADELARCHPLSGNATISCDIGSGYMSRRPMKWVWRSFTAPEQTKDGH